MKFLSVIVAHEVSGNSINSLPCDFFSNKNIAKWANSGSSEEKK